MSLPNAVYLAIIEGILLLGSLFILSIQKIQNRQQLTDTLILKVDTQRDTTNESFSNKSASLKRIIFDTIVSSTFSACTLVTHVYSIEPSPSHKKQESIYIVIASAITFVTWIYALVIALTSLHFPFPSRFRWILNIHLFILYLSLFSTSVDVLIEYVWNDPNIASVQCLFLFVPAILAFDLIYTTGTIKKGLLFLDDKGNKVSSVSAESIAGTFSYNWMTSVITAAGSKGKDFTDADLPRLPSTHRSFNLSYIFDKTRGRKLWYRIYSTNKTTIMIQTLLLVVISSLNFAPPFFLNKLLMLIQSGIARKDDDRSVLIGVGYLLAMAGTDAICGLLRAQLIFQEQSNFKVRVKSMLNIELYRKTLRHTDVSSLPGDNSNTDEQEKNEDKDNSSNVGTIFNLMSNDAVSIADLSTNWGYALSIPIELTIGIYFIYTLLGWSCFLGLLVMVATIPLNQLNVKVSEYIWKKRSETKDKRVSLMEEALQGIRQIKSFAWESSWIKRIMESRDAEIKILKLGWAVNQIMFFVWQGPPLLITAISFWSFTKLNGHELSAAVAFTSITVFNELASSLSYIPTLITCLSELSVHVKRIEKYLNEDEAEQPIPTCLTKTGMPSSTSSSSNTVSGIKIGFENATITWPTSKETQKASDKEDEGSLESTGIVKSASPVFALRDLDVIFPNNKLSLVCGPTGSGKTLLVLSLLGETKTLKGSVFFPRYNYPSNLLYNVTDITSIKIDQDAPSVPDDWILEYAVAYVSQAVWLQNASIKENILFGLPYVEKRYKDTITACALDKDLSYLEDADLTEIGEKGITLSGGQKARVALARAVYSRAQNVLMDDVLSAVDAHTSRHLYDKCLMGPLMQNRTQILVTHNINLCIQGSAYITFIKEGRVKLSGSPEELQEKNQLSQIFEGNANKTIDENKPDDEDVDVENKPCEQTNRKQEKKPKVLIEEELRSTGTVKLKLYRFYLSLMGNWFFWAAFVISIFGGKILGLAANWWLKIWTESYGDPDNGNSSAIAATLVAHRNLFMPLRDSVIKQLSIQTPVSLNTIIPSNLSQVSHLVSETDQAGHSLNYYLTIYVIIESLSTASFLVRYGFIFWGGLTAGQKIYKRLIDRIFYAPLRYYDTTPIGRILSRISSDFGTVDETVAFDIAAFFSQWVGIFFVIVAAILSIPVLVFPLIIIGVINVFFALQFVNALRELKRMESVSRSPLFTMFSETITGVTTIRAFGMTQQFMLGMYDRIDSSNRPLYYVSSCSRWIDARMALIGATITLATGTIILFNIDQMDASTVGFCLSYVLSYTSMTFWGVRRYTSLEMCFNSVERVVELLEIDQEAPSITDIRPPANWPSEGVLEVNNLHVKYASDLETVLKGLTFTVKPQEKVGIVGRTGSGKSTLALSLYRFIEATKGSIIIDGINIADIGIEDLRSKLTIIPQNPALFSGTLRSNMDPFNQFTDENILTAFKRVCLLKGPSQGNDDSQGSLSFPHTTAFDAHAFARFTKEEIHTAFVEICDLKELFEKDVYKPNCVLTPGILEASKAFFDQFISEELLIGFRICQFLNKPSQKSAKSQSLWQLVVSVFFSGNTHSSNPDSLDQFTSEEISIAFQIIQFLNIPYKRNAYNQGYGFSPSTILSNTNLLDQLSNEQILANFRAFWHLVDSKDKTGYQDVSKNSDTPVTKTDNQDVFRNLDTPVTNSGNNFSQGQRQLLCLARALLYSNKIIIMDEATASIDFETDKAIQKTIATDFVNSTVLCIAHRLNTVIEYDRILVLDHGEVMEFANPLELIRDPNSAFHQMCRKSNDYENLLEAVRTKHELVDVL